MSLLGGSQVFFWMFYVAMTTFNASSGVRAVTMSSRSQVHVLNPGQSVQLECEFLEDDFNLFDNPVIWKKSQTDEQTQVNIMGNIFAPFLDTGRYDVTFESKYQRYCLTLSLLNVILEDSGNYTCEVRGRGSSVLASVTHYIVIRAAVEDVILYTDNATYRSPSSSAKVISFVEGVPRAVGCVSRGGYPLPQVTLYLGDLDVTDLFSPNHASALEGVRGLRLLRYEVVRWTDVMKVKAEDDGSLLRCSVTVPGLEPRSSSAIVTVNYGPVISCRVGLAFVDETNVNLVCEVRSRPGLTRLFWILDENNSTTSTDSAGLVGDYWSIVRDRSDGVVETQLFMKRATPGAFRTYSVVAENAIATTVETVQLQRRFEPSTVASALIREELQRPDVEKNWKREQEQEPRIVRTNSQTLDNQMPGLWRYITSSATAGSSVSMATMFTFTLLYFTLVY